MRAVDVIVVGGGVVGCAVALRLRQRGARVTLLDRGVPGAEASSAAAGILAGQTEAAEGTPTFELGLRSAALHGPLAAELCEATGIDVGYRRSGVLHVAWNASEAALLAKNVDWQRGRRLRAETVDAAGVRTLEPALSDHIAGAALFADDAQVDPPVLARALAGAATLAGVEMVAGTPVRHVVVQGGRVRGVETDVGERLAGVVVVAAGSWSSLLHGSGLAPNAVRPVRGQIVVLETRPPLVRHVVYSHRGYLVPRPDGRVLCGSTLERVGYQKDVTAEGVAAVLRNAVDLAPRLAAAPIAATWAGLRPATNDTLPAIGRTRVDGLFVATGHFTNGILFCTGTAEAIAALVAAEPPPFDLAAFDPERLAASPAA